MTSLAECVTFLDRTLAIAEVPDYDRALNGLQLANQGTVTRVAAAVDYSGESVHQAVEAGADLLLVHHGMFWGGNLPIVGSAYRRMREAMIGNLAVYSSHLPLDLHPTLGNNVRLAEHLGLQSDGRFGHFRTIQVGVSGYDNLRTEELAHRVQNFVQPLGSHVVCTPYTPDRRTTRWALITGAGASSDTLAEAAEHGIDTLIVGEGPHHTAIEARDLDIVVIYAGHYATETLGVRAIAHELQATFALPWSFIHLPTGL